MSIVEDLVRQWMNAGEDADNEMKRRKPNTYSVL